MDVVDKQTRSRMMSAVQAKNSKLESEIRKSLFAKGFRYRTHVRMLPGTPDIVLPKYNTVIFVHGCFWHYHGCTRSKIPETRREWWKNKLENNRKRDRRNLEELLNRGWRVVTIWECSVRISGTDREKSLDNVCLHIIRFLRSDCASIELSGPTSSRCHKA